MRPISTPLIFAGFFLLYICLSLPACSPYKKVSLSMSDRLTERWKGSTEGEVIKSIGSYKIKKPQADGYVIRFDYSYALAPPATSSTGTHFSVSNQPSSLMIPSEPHTTPPGATGTADSVIHRLDFYFDGSAHVQTVTATGYPDSVYYVKRSKH
jgi:hypothetical protein